MLDEEGYKMLELKFESMGCSFEWLQDLEDGWRIYKKTSLKTGRSKYELIRPIKNEETNFGGNTSPKRWSYPGNTAFGRIGFDCFSLERALDKHKEIMAKKEEPTKIQIQIPSSKKFTLTDICDLNPQHSRSKINTKLLELIEDQKIRCLGPNVKYKGKGKKPLLYEYTK